MAGIPQNDPCFVVLENSIKIARSAPGQAGHAAGEKFAQLVGALISLRKLA
jgi:hypothetical protein